MNLNKRQKIIIVSVILSLGLISTQLVNFNLRFKFMFGLAAVAYFLSLWALWTGINKTKAVILLVLPTLYTLAISSYYFVLPIRWLTRLPVAIIFGLSFYLLLLSQNVFNVASIRTIPLYRAASTAAFLFTWIAALFFYNVIDSLNLLFIWNAVAVILISFPLVLQLLWSVEMEDRVSSDNIAKSFVISLILGEFALALSFLPPIETLITTLWSFQVAVMLYILVGITLDDLRSRLNSREVRWYLIVGIFVFITSLMIYSWVG